VLDGEELELAARAENRRDRCVVAQFCRRIGVQCESKNPVRRVWNTKIANSAAKAIGSGTHRHGSVISRFCAHVFSLLGLFFTLPQGGLIRREKE
jgi:hypothetical protein